MRPGRERLQPRYPTRGWDARSRKRQEVTAARLSRGRHRRLERFATILTCLAPYRHTASNTGEKERERIASQELFNGARAILEIWSARTASQPFFLPFLSRLPSRLYTKRLRSLSLSLSLTRARARLTPRWIRGSYQLWFDSASFPSPASSLAPPRPRLSLFFDELLALLGRRSRSVLQISHGGDTDFKESSRLRVIGSFLVDLAGCGYWPERFFPREDAYTMGRRSEPSYGLPVGFSWWGLDYSFLVLNSLRSVSELSMPLFFILKRLRLTGSSRGFLGVSSMLGWIVACVAW